jgi:cytidine deaminase
MTTPNAHIEEPLRRRLIAAATAARTRAHAPYSGFAVGAAALFEEDAIFEGCNVENASLGATVCAERVAILHGILHGRAHLRALAVVAEGETNPWPCGLCRQVIAEFGPDCEILAARPGGEAESASIRDLMPRPFTGYAPPRPGSA